MKLKSETFYCNNFLFYSSIRKVFHCRVYRTVNTFVFLPRKSRLRIRQTIHREIWTSWKLEWNLAELCRKVCKLEFVRDVLTHPGLCSSFFFSAWWIRRVARRGTADGNSSPRVRKFLFNVLFIPHFSYLLLPFYRPQKTTI